MYTKTVFFGIVFVLGTHLGTPLVLAQSAPSPGGIPSQSAAEMQNTINALKERLLQLQRQSQKNIPAPLIIAPRDAENLNAALLALTMTLQQMQSRIARGEATTAESAVLAKSLGGIVTRLATINATIIGQRSLAIAPPPPVAPPPLSSGFAASVPLVRVLPPIPEEPALPALSPMPGSIANEAPRVEDIAALSESSGGTKGGFPWVRVTMSIVVIAAGAWIVWKGWKQRRGEEPQAPPVAVAPQYIPEENYMMTGEHATEKPVL